MRAVGNRNLIATQFKVAMLNEWHILISVNIHSDYFFLGAFEKFRKATLSFVMTNRLSIRMEKLGSHIGIFMKFDIWAFFKNLSRKQVSRQQQLHEWASILRNAQVVTKWQKEPGKATEDMSGCVRLERVNKWPKCMIAIWWWWW